MGQGSIDDIADLVEVPAPDEAPPRRAASRR
jgi:hypothetical protein